MATEAQRRQFIKEMGQCARSSFARIGKVLPSVAVAMACVECAYGTAGSCKHHSYFGFKVGTGKTATQFWDGKFFVARTGEEYVIGQHTTITAAFRAYENMQQSCDNFYELLNTGLYKGVQHGSDYRAQMQQIKAAGYMTSSTEVNTVIQIIEKYGLTDLDGVQEKKSQYALPNGPDIEIRFKTKTLRQGCKGREVKTVQLLLESLGYKIIPDGYYGSGTRDIVKKFQDDRCLIADGVAGVRTLTKLLHDVMVE